MWLPYHGKLHCSVKHQRPITSNIYYLNANNPSGSIKNRTPWGVPSSSESGVRRGGPISCCSSSGSSSFSSSSSPASSSSSDFCEGLIQTQRPYNQEGRIMNTCNKRWRHASQLKQLVHTQAQVGEKEKKKVFHNWYVVDRELYVPSWQSALFIPHSFLIPFYQLSICLQWTEDRNLVQSLPVVCWVCILARLPVIASWEMNTYRLLKT